MKFKHLLLPTLALACTLPAGAVKALNKFVPMVQPDGSTIQVKKCGDESSHYLISTDGALLTQVGDAWYFGTLDASGRIASSGVLAADPVARNSSQRNAAVIVGSDFMPSLSKARLANSPLKTRKRVVEQDGMGRFTSNFPRKGDIRSVVILVEYKDVPFTLADPFAYFNGMLNTDGFSQYGATGCVAEYFRQNSTDQFRPVFDVLGPVKLPQNRSYYGANDMWGNDVCPEDMVVHAVQALDPTVDFSVYDMDGDGTLDNIFVIYAGQGESSYGSANTVWPHSFELSEVGKSFKVDGVTVNSYGCSNEWDKGRPDGSGTFTHEFSHVMGLPDLYDTYGNLTCTPGSWSVLDYGPYNNDGATPPNYSTFERLAMGWIDPIVLNGPACVELANLADTNNACIIQTPKSTEYYLFENRQQTGFDEYLPGHGMLIWHVDFNQFQFDNNAVNNNAAHQYVELKKANGIKNGTSDDIYAGWSWPGTSRKTSFTDDTNPSMKTWTNQALNLPITEIKETDGVITFNVAGGIEYVTAPELLVPDTGTSTWFNAKWLPVENATDYLLTVVEKAEGGAPVVHSNDMGSGTKLSLPDGWTSNGNDVYTTNSNYGIASPSYKMNADGIYMTSPAFDSDVTKITFWHKGMQLEGGSIEITGKDMNGADIEIALIYPNRSSSKYEIISNVPAGVRQVSFIYHKVTGNVAIDDIELYTSGSSMKIIDGYNRLSTNGQVSYRVEHPEAADNVTYAFYVEATDGEHISKPSAIMDVPALNNGGSSVEMVEANALTITGRTLNANAEYSVTDLAARVLFSGKGPYTIPQAGVYVVRKGNSVSKIMVR